jgi:HKD family nuclease
LKGQPQLWIESTNWDGGNNSPETGELVMALKALQAENELLKHFTTELASASEFYLGMALVTKAGLDLIIGSIERCLERRGRGCVLFGVDLPTDPEAIRSLCELQVRHRNFEVRRFQAGNRFFHPKLSVFVRRSGVKTAIIGSSNLTGGGLSQNHETNVFLSDRRVVHEFQDYFEEHFQGAHARKVDQRWLDQYRRLWAERKKAEQRQRRLREKARGLGRPPAKIINRIKDQVFAFTGKIADWPRNAKLYPYVKRRGGHVAETARAMGSANCLVHGEILGGRKSTRKLVKARQLNIPIITEEQFFNLLGLRRAER